MAESRPTWIRKIPACSTSLIQLAFNLMLSVEDIPLEEWNALEVNQLKCYKEEEKHLTII